MNGQMDQEILLTNGLLIVLGLQINSSVKFLGYFNNNFNNQSILMKFLSTTSKHKYQQIQDI